ncbi:MAG TPA: sugar transferase, partial [Burkholderiales bacterium]|nr:sugar transferase [Burkholderiales bacterium]
AYLSWKIRQTGGAAIFRHMRVGRYGRMFGCLKFRTMVLDAEGVLRGHLDADPGARAEWERDFKLKDDPRITPIGAFLRKTSLDELPQLWNVLKGEMSLVGPRPIIEEELERYGDQVGYYLETRPGVTGLWQISGRNDTGYEDRVALDSWYVRNWSLWYDLVILVKTINVVLRRKGAY